MPHAPLDRKPVWEQVADRLRCEVAQRSPGERLESEAQLAARFAVSIGSVREALATLAREGRVVRRHGSGTYVAERGVGRHVAVLIELDISLGRVVYYHWRLVQEIRRQLAAAQMPARLYAGHVGPGEMPKGWTCHEFTEDLDRDLISGVAVVASRSFEHFMGRLARSGIPTVGDDMPVYPYRVHLDYDDLIAQGVSLLLAGGRRRLALICGPEPQAAVFSRRLEAAGLTVRSEWIRSKVELVDRRSAWRVFRELWTARADRPDGLLVTDEHMLTGVAMASLELGVRIPDDLCVASQVTQGAGLEAPFPVVRLAFDPDEVAGHMVRMLMRLMRGETVEPRVVTVRCRRVETNEGAGEDAGLRVRDAEVSGVPTS